ncbi:hypothetical protein PCCS19_27500 [Paenibacillus sp. CCS19]|uniref:hypothetical protein n=1 Tax=Paenibacillus sp. CCS19 TaxID=3158387 RepID=UPI002563BD0A|nr:hypothetical protein [Paenibacillus cellulosilyticus]GMK39695.1 hypothetical protein PCCS19_27500 [Paenibacillus cellulosilyticus]
MKRKSVIMTVAAAAMMAAAVPAYVAVKAEAKPERTAVAVKAEAKPERALAVAGKIGPDSNQPDMPEVPLV